MNRKIILPSVLIFLIAAKVSRAQSYVIEPVAGIEARSDTGDNGPATASGLSAPWGVAVDDSGNLYIGDQLNSRIQKVNTKGIITTVAGSDTAYHLNDGGPATDAGLSEPLGVAIAPSGVLYISDWNHRRIRKVDKNGIITTYGGTGTDGYTGDGGPATDAEISGVYGIITDKYGNLYLADDYNYVVRKIDTNDIITTFAGNGTAANNGDGGPATDAGIWGPTGVAADNEGNIYISTAGYVRKVDTNGIITTVAGNGTVGHTGDDGLATNAEIGGAYDIGVDDSNNLYIVEEFKNYIRKVYPNDTITTISGDGVYGYSDYYGNPDTASMEWGQGIIIDSFGNVYFADNNQVRELSPCSPIVTTNPASPSICYGQSITLSAKGRNDYSWSPGTSLNYDSTGLTVSATPTVTTTYSISGTVCYASTSIVVTVDTLPNLQINPSPASTCQGQPIQLVASGATSYQWSPSEGLSDSTGSSVIFNLNNSTIYYVTGSNSFGCSVTDTETVSVTSSPNKPTFIQNGDTLTSSSEYDNQWYHNDSILTGDTSQNLIFSVNGNYFVIVSNEANGCGTSSDTMDVTATGINQLTVDKGQWTVYPNPANELLTVNSEQLSINTIEIVNVIGQVVYSSLYNSEIKKETIDVSELPGGVYFLSVSNNSSSEIFKVVKE